MSFTEKDKKYLEAEIKAHSRLVERISKEIGLDKKTFGEEGTVEYLSELAEQYEDSLGELDASFSELRSLLQKQNLEEFPYLDHLFFLYVILGNKPFEGVLDPSRTLESYWRFRYGKRKTSPKPAWMKKWPTYRKFWGKDSRQGIPYAWKNVKKVLLEALETSIPPERVYTQTEIHGFTVVVVEPPQYTPTSQDIDTFNFFRETLRQYRARLKRYFPLLLKKAPPLYVVIKAKDWGYETARGFKVKGGADAFYLKKREETYFSFPVFRKWVRRKSDPVARTLKVLAHEMAHYWYYSVMSQKDRERWENFVRMREESFKGSDLIAYMEQNDIDKISDLPDDLRVLVLNLLEEYPYIKRIYSLQASKTYDLKALSSALKSHRTKKKHSGVYKVKTVRTTRYGDTKPSEDFAEAIGLMIGYGPRRLNANTRTILKDLLKIPLRVNKRIRRGRR